MSWPTPFDLDECRTDLENLIKDWNLLIKYQAFLLGKKIAFKPGHSHLSAEGFEVTVRKGKYCFKSINCRGDWDQATEDAYEKLSQKFWDWLKPKLSTSEDVPGMEKDDDLDLV